MPYEPIVPQGASLAASRKVAGAVSGLAFRDGKLQGPVAWKWLEDLADDLPPVPSRLVPIALAAVAGIALGVAGSQTARNLSKQPDRAAISAEPSMIVSPGWYLQSADSTQMRYWDGSGWTNYLAARAEVVAAADWYPDPGDQSQLRYWNGQAWTEPVAPSRAISSTPADWYPDPEDDSRWRYWDGSAWTGHFAPRDGRKAVAAAAVSAHELPTHDSRQPATPMTSAEWRATFHAWAVAESTEQELWRRLTTAQLKDADAVALEAQRALATMSPQEGASRLRSLLAEIPDLRDKRPLDVLMSAVLQGSPRPFDRSRQL